MLWTPTLERFPRPFILKTLEIFKERNLRSIVEIGCMRQPLSGKLEEPNVTTGGNDGFSSLYWCGATNDFTTVDITPSSIQTTISECKKYLGKNIVGIVMDGIDYIRNRKEKIDLLFLDFLDADLPESAEKHLEAFKVAEKNLHDNSLVLIDDTDIEVKDGVMHIAENGRGGKGRLLIPYMESVGWKVLFTGRQTLLSK